MIPVSRISTTGLWSSNDGGSLWITQCSVSSLISSPLSMVSPSTLNRRPRVCSPTGTLIPEPVAVTSMSLQSPSLAASIRQRTSSFPRCCATSIIQVFPLFSTCRASLMHGRFPSSNTTSTTGPMTCTIRPLFIPVFTSFSVSGLWHLHKPQ